MTQNHRASFINRVRQSLGPDIGPADVRQARIFPQTSDAVTQNLLQTVQSRTTQERETLLTVLMDQALPLNLHVTPVADPAEAAQQIAALVRQKNPEWGEKKALIRWSHPLLDALELESVLADQHIPVHITAMDPHADLQKQRQVIREKTIDSFMGITAADYCVADTATIVMKTYPHQGRAVSLLPAVHVAVITLDQILTNLTELYAVLDDYEKNTPKNGLTHHMVFISGPSKTADIELTMVHGAHGPKEMHIFVVRA
ncbi:MAG TPA: lactate utilization protein [Desulfotignum sp.]|nr:lactate utilization protein [Desulfotignum sp.]